MVVGDNYKIPFLIICLNRCHSPNSVIMAFKCFVCQLVIHGKLSKLFTHLHSAHALYDGPGLVVRCDQGGCLCSFFTFNSLRKHLLKTHSEQVEHEAEHAAVLHLENPAGSELENDSDDPGQDESGGGGAENEDRPFEELIKEHAGLFLTELLSQPNVTHVTAQKVIYQTTSLVDRIVSDLETKTRDFILASGIEQLDVPECSRLFQAFHGSKHPFYGLESRYKQNQFFEEKLGLIKPQSVILGARFDTSVDCGDGHTKQIVVQDSFQYIPLKLTLGVLLSNIKIQEEINNVKASNDGVLRHYCDGAQFKSHPLLSTYPDSLQISLFYDEFEVCNPIGSKRGIHKLGGLYYTLQNLHHDGFNSTLHNIHMLALFSSIDLVKYGFEPILAPFMSELAELESDAGMELVLRDGKVIRKRGTLIQTPADNLGANAICGYVESFAANYPCRFCLTSRAEMQTCFVSDHCDMRTRENYELNVQSLLQNPQSVSQHGVKKVCSLNQSRYFHVTNNYSPDVMHDILEGVGKLECKLVLYHLIYVNKFFTLELLNERIACFGYSFTDCKNKPSRFDERTLQSQDSNLKNTASQMWCLLRVLPILVGDKVPRGDQHWELFILLRRIMDVAFAREVTQSMIAHLKLYIEDHHSLFKKLFPDRNLIPKHHFLVHYPQLIQEVGPLINCWCMRYEAKHAIGKSIANVVCNFKDISYTIAERNQIRQCHMHFTGGAFKDTMVEHLKSLLVRDIEGKDEVLHRFPELGEADEIQVTNRVSISGTEYRSGMILITGAEEYMPAFGQVKAVYGIGDTFYLFGVLWRTDGFDDHYFAYEVCCPRRKRYFLLKQCELKDYHPLAACQSYKQEEHFMYVVLRSSLTFKG